LSIRIPAMVILFFMMGRASCRCSMNTATRIRKTDGGIIVNDYGKIIREARIAEGLSQAALSKKAHVCRDTVYRIEGGWITSVSVLESVLGALGMRLEVVNDD